MSGREATEEEKEMDLDEERKALGRTEDAIAVGS